MSAMSVRHYLYRGSFCLCPFSPEYGTLALLPFKSVLNLVCVCALMLVTKFMEKRTQFYLFALPNLHWYVSDEVGMGWSRETPQAERVFCAGTMTGTCTYTMCTAGYTTKPNRTRVEKKKKNDTQHAPAPDRLQHTRVRACAYVRV